MVHFEITGKSKEEVAIERIKAFCPPEGYWVGISGGKDSSVINDLVIRSGVKSDFHFHLTSIDPPEVIKFVKNYMPHVEIHRPASTMWKLIVENGMPPTRLIKYCCRILKEGGGESRTVVTGIRWEESSRRGKRKMVEACFRDNRKFYIHPIIDWSSEDVWQYIRSHNLPYCQLYDEGWKRIGCIMCPENRNRINETKRWPTYKQAYIRALDRALVVARAKGNKATFSNGEDYFNWWVTNSRTGKTDPDQTVMFE